MRSNTTYDTKQNMRNKAEVSFSICTLSNPYEMGTSWQFKCVFWLPTTENRRRVSSKYATDITWCRLWSYHQLPDANCRRKNRASCETQILHTYAPRDDWDLFVLFVAVWRAGDVKINRFWEHFYLAFFRHMAWLISQISLLGWLCCALSCVLSCHQIFPSRNFTLSPDRSSSSLLCREQISDSSHGSFAENHSFKINVYQLCLHSCSPKDAGGVGVNSVDHLLLLQPLLLLTPQLAQPALSPLLLPSQGCIPILLELTPIKICQIWATSMAPYTFAIPCSSPQAQPPSPPPTIVRFKLPISNGILLSRLLPLLVLLLSLW